MSQRLCIAVLVVALVSLQSVLAHYTITYPNSRGFDETKEPTAPCGGFDTVGTRTPFPLKGGFVEISSGHTSYSYVVNLLVENAPTTADFSNSTANVQVATGSRSYPQAACLSLDNLSKNAAAKAGANATIQVVYNGGDGELYQCIDVTLADNVGNWNNSMCVNADGSSTASSGSGSGSASASGSAAASTQSPSNANSLTYTGGLMFAIAACLALVIN
ncbi:Ribosome biogenesis ATPase rix7 [Mucor velutinosus]|uniref:Ribosome biogenesis ATPase rix7 n=1 Tax=Mucor velutinosus TaxID=708070 RepID=A0AAN7DEL2_9FUNG|nr:Ribosome biogenesis ATPase rix7 [Mucor velutinosus]